MSNNIYIEIKQYIANITTELFNLIASHSIQFKIFIQVERKKEGKETH